MKSLIIDLSCVGEVKILHAKVTSSVSIIAGYYLTLTPNDDAIAATATKLRDENILDLPAFIIPPVELVEKQNFQLPKMPDKEIRKVLPREIASASDSPEPMIFNYLNNGPVEDRQAEKQEIATFYCQKEKMFEFLKQLGEAGLKPQSIIPEVQGLKTLTEMSPTFGNPRTGVVFLELMDTRINLNIFKEKYWGLERDFLYRMERIEGEDDLNDEDFTRISTELNRTFQYFKQRNRGYAIDQVILYGTSGNIEHLKNMINDNQPVTANSIKADYFGGKISFPSHLKDSLEFISFFTLPIATAIAISNKKFLDLYPEEFKERSKLTFRLIGLTVSAAIIAAILFGSTFYFEGIKNSYKKDIKDLDKTYLTLSKNASTIISTKKQRANFYERRHYIDYPIKYSHSMANFVRKLSLIASEHLELTELEITPGNQSYRFKLDGLIKSDDNIMAQSRFLEFYQKLKEFDDVIDASSSKVTINPNEKTSAPQVNDPATSKPLETKQTILYFTIDGQIELE
jgi:hypothetical protein